MPIENFEQQTTVFVMGSPGSGFSSFPKNYLHLVEKYDDSTKPKGFVRSEYIIKKNIATLIYIKYGLTGASKHDQVRGGRNFGIIIQTEGFQVNSDRIYSLYNYLGKVFTQSIVDNLKILKKEDDNYQITLHDFLAIENRLVPVLEIVKKHFLKQFNESFEEIKIDAFYELDPVKIELRKEEEKRRIEEEKRRKAQDKLRKQRAAIEDKDVGNEKPTGDIDPDLFIGKPLKEVSEWDLQMIFNAILTAVVLGLLIAHIVHVFSANSHRSLIEEALKSQNVQNRSRLNDPDDFKSTDAEVLGTNQEELDNDTEDSVQDNSIYIVTSGDILTSIVIEHNATFNTNFKTEEIAKFNNIKDIAAIKIGQKIKFPEQ